MNFSLRCTIFTLRWRKCLSLVNSLQNFLALIFFHAKFNFFFWLKVIFYDFQAWISKSVICANYDINGWPWNGLVIAMQSAKAIVLPILCLQLSCIVSITNYDNIGNFRSAPQCDTLIKHQNVTLVRIFSTLIEIYCSVWIAGLAQKGNTLSVNAQN